MSSIDPMFRKKSLTILRKLRSLQPADNHDLPIIHLESLAKRRREIIAQQKIFKRVLFLGGFQLIERCFHLPESVLRYLLNLIAERNLII